MTTYGDFEREQMKREMERESQDMERSGAQFMGMLVWSVIIILTGTCGVFFIDWAEHFFRHSK